MNLGPDAWRTRDAPLLAAAVAGFGPVAPRLGRRALDLDPEQPWQAAAGEGVLLLVGPAAELPWVEGVRYLGRDPRCPRLLLPTTHAPPVHPELILRRLGPVALVLDPTRRLPLSALGPLDRETLARWLEAT